MAAISIRTNGESGLLAIYPVPAFCRLGLPLIHRCQSCHQVPSMSVHNTLAVRGSKKPQAQRLRLQDFRVVAGFLPGVPYGARTRNLMFHRQALCH